MKNKISKTRKTEITLEDLAGGMSSLSENLDNFQQLVVKQFDKVNDNFERVWVELKDIRLDISEIKKEISQIKTELGIINKRVLKLEEKIDPDSNLRLEVEDLKKKLNHVYTILKNNGIQIA